MLIFDCTQHKKDFNNSKTQYLAVFRQSPNDLSNIYLGSRAPLEEEVEHLLPDINNQDVVSEPLLQVNDEVSDMLLTSSKVDREDKQLPNLSSNSSLESNSARAPELIRKKPVPAPPKVKGSCPTNSKTTTKS